MMMAEEEVVVVVVYDIGKSGSNNIVGKMVIRNVIVHTTIEAWCITHIQM